MIQLSHPNFVRKILLEDTENYVKGWSYDIFRELWGNGLVTAEGSDWKRERRMIQPLFNKSHLDQMVGAMIESVNHSIESWNPSGGTVDFNQAMGMMTLKILSRIIFGGNLTGSEFEEIRHASEMGSEATLKIFSSPLPLPRWVPIPSHLRFKHAIRSMDDVVYKMIERRKKDPSDRDLLGKLLTAKDPETNQSISLQQVRDEAVTLLFAGHETTANTLCWMFMLLSQNPEVASKIQEEVDRITGRDPLGQIQPEHVSALEYTRAAFSETLRLFPSAWSTMRTAKKDDVIGGFRIKTGDLVFLPQVVVHKDPRFWSEPERFMPERFLKPNELKDRHAYFPFSAGQRICIGNTFATLESVAIVAAIFKRFQWSAAFQGPIGYKALITMTPDRAMPFRLERRT